MGDSAEADPGRGIDNGRFSIIGQGIAWWNEDGASQGRGYAEHQGSLGEGNGELHVWGLGDMA